MNESAPLRVLYLQPAPLFGGAERQAVEQAAALERFGIEVTVVAGPGSAIIDWLEAKSVRRVIKSANFPGGWPKQRGLLKATLPFRVLDCGLRADVELNQLVAHGRYQAILASLPFAWITGALVAHRHHLPIAWRAGGAYINPAQAAGMWALTRFLRPDLLICNGLAVARTFRPVVPAPVALLPNGVDLERFHPDASPVRYRPAEATVVVGYAARLATRKRPQDVVAMGARLRRSVPGARVLIAGEGSRRPEYERQAQELGADNVRFLGYVSDMPAFYAACDIVVLPSSCEGSSNVLLEAMACGKAVVCSDIPPLVEQIRDHETGLIHRLGDVDGLAASVELLAVNPALRASLAARGLEVARRSSNVRAAECLAGLVRRLVAEYAAGTGGASRADSSPGPRPAPAAEHESARAYPGREPTRPRAAPSAD